MSLRSPIVGCAIVLLAITGRVTSGEPSLLWEVHLNPDYPQFVDSTADLAVDKSGNIFVLGTTETSDGLNSSLLNKYGIGGEEVWFSRTTRSGQRFTRGNALALDSGGQPIFVATTTETDGSDGQLIVMKWSATGGVLFSALINQPAGTTAEGIAVAVDASDHFYVAANHSPAVPPGTPPSALTTGFLRKYSPAGEPEWALPLPHPDAASTRVNAMTLDLAGHVLLTGRAVLNTPASQPAAASDAEEEQTTYATFKVSPAGAIEWSDLYARSTRGDNHAAAIATDKEGGVYVTGTSSSPHSTTLTDVTTLKYTAAGTRAWVSHFDAIEQASENLGERSFAGTSLAVDDNVWVGCSPYLLLRLSTFNGSDWGLAYSYYGAASGVDATIDRLLLLEPGRGMLHTGSISDASSANDLYVQHTDVSLNLGWSFRFHPADTGGSEIVDMARGIDDRVHFAANYSLPNEPSIDGVLFTVAPPSVPTVQVFAVEPLALEPLRAGWPGINARFRVRLSSPAEHDLTINYSLEGTAHWDIDDGADYHPPSPLGTLVIRAGRTSGDIVIRPLADKLREAPESVRLTLSPTSLPTLNDYQLGRATNATVWILDAVRLPFWFWR